MSEDSDTYLKAALNSITDLDRLTRMARRTPKPAGWQDILDTP